MNHSQNKIAGPSGSAAQASFLPPDSLPSASGSAFRILESITDAFFALDREFRFTYVNAQAERVLLRPRAGLLGRCLWDEFPAAVGSTFERQYRRAADEQVAVTFEEFFAPLAAWFEVRAFPFPDGLSVFFHDITEQTKRRQREQFLAQLAERARSRTDPEDIIFDAVCSLGQFLGVSRCIFADIDIEADTCTIHPHYRADDSVANIEGVVPISAFGAYVVAEYAARRAVAVDDVRLDPLRAPAGSLAAYEAVGIRAHVTVPVVHSGRIVSCISVHNAAPRHWESDEVELLRTVVEQTWLTVEVLRQQRALVRGAEATARTLDSLTDAFFMLDRAFRFTFVNRQAEAMWGTTRAELVGRSAWEVFPDSVGGVFYHQYHRVMENGIPESVEDFYPRLDAWLDVKAFPSPDGISVFFQNVTERKNLERRERFLADLAERVRVLTDPAEVIADAVRSVGQFLGVSRCVFADIDTEADTCSIPVDYCADDSVVSIAGVFPISAFGPFVVNEYNAGRSVAIDDTGADPIRVPPDYLTAYEAIGIRAYVTVPVMHSARLVSAIAVHHAAPRRWKAEEVDLLRSVVERTWLTVEVLRQERALVREAEATARILESITDAFFTLDRDWNVTYVNDRADQLMTKKRPQILGRNFWEVYPKLIGSTFEREYRRAMAEGIAVAFEVFYPPLEAWLEVRAYPFADGLSVFYQDISARKRSEEALRESEERYRLLVESTAEGVYGVDLAGQFTFANKTAARLLGFTQEQIIGQSNHALIHHSRSDGAPYPEAECPISHALRSGQSTQADDDVFWRADGTSFPVAYSAAPIFEQGAVRGVVVTFSDISERKALDQERERLAQRERNIAAHLQAALTPTIPEHIPGLALTKHYEAALAEAGVGGDFYDVFPIERGCTALVIGDLSGKGLAAATQVATVRNMLRYALYRARTLAGALDSLNTLLVKQDLLTGFATLFVGAYNSVAGTLTYVNCGQEPALVRRSAGPVECLPPTGPVLGSFEGALFEEQAVALRSGDALAMFTDGLTEVGRSRTEMLGVEGVAELLARAVAPPGADSPLAVAEHLALDLIAGVDAAAADGVTRDDVCLLVGVVA